MSKARTLNKTITTLLILLLTMSILGVAFNVTFFGVTPVSAQTVSVVTPSTLNGTVFTPVTLEGLGWYSLATLRIYFNSSTWFSGILYEFASNATGGFSKDVTVPAVIASTAYNYTWYVVQPGTPSTAVANFTVIPGIGVDPSSGPVGTSVRVYGSASDLASKLVSVIYNKDNDTIYDAVESLVNVTANSDGIFDTTVTIPDLTVPTIGVDYVTFFYANRTPTGGVQGTTFSATDYYNATFTVKAPTLTCSPISGMVGSSVSVAANYFKILSYVNMTFNTTSLAGGTNIPTNSTGGFNQTFTVPTCMNASLYIFNATDLNLNRANATFTVVSPTLTISPSTGIVGGSITVTGLNFTVLGTVNIRFSINTDTYIEHLSVLNVTANATGGFSTSVTVPSVPSDAEENIVWVNATDTCNLATADFNVTAAITLSQIRGATGANVTATGTGFGNSTTVDIIFGSATVANVTVADDKPTDAYGSFTTTFLVPSVVDGTYIVNATDTEGTNATLSFQVSASEFLDILLAIDEIECKLDNVTYGLIPIKQAIDAVKAVVDTIKVSVDAIISRMGSFSGADTIASLLYAIKAKTDTIDWADINTILTKVTNIEDKLILAPSEIKFDFGTETSPWEPDFIQVTPSTAYSSDLGYGWTNTTGLYSRDRAAPDYTRRDFVFSSLNRTFKIDLSNGNYTVIITMGDQSYAHDNMTIYAEGTLKATVTTTAGTFVQKVFTVSVTDGNLELMFVDAGGIDANWVINALIVQRSWN